MAQVSGAAETIRRLQQYPVQYRATVRHVFAAQAERITQRMKAEHKWKNRSGDAERELHCDVREVGAAFVLAAGHGPDIFYGAFLEHGFQGRYAILAPMMRAQWPYVMRTLQAALREQRGVQRGGGL